MPSYTKPPFQRVVCHMDLATWQMLSEHGMVTIPAPARHDGAHAHLVSIPAERIASSIEQPCGGRASIQLHNGYAVSFGHRDINALPSYTEAWISYAPGMERAGCHRPRH